MLSATFVPSRLSGPDYSKDLDTEFPYSEDPRQTCVKKRYQVAFISQNREIKLGCTNNFGNMRHFYSELEDLKHQIYFSFSYFNIMPLQIPAPNYNCSLNKLNIMMEAYKTQFQSNQNLTIRLRKSAMCKVLGSSLKHT